VAARDGLIDQGVGLAPTPVEQQPRARAMEKAVVSNS
jgi:hypothetical protein